ncbi:hypothetical protein F5X98DRAFT_344329 [Xylaria grammica]|nr:hypothetical protein F5X98DRAFT_344329 [Xylaria grammica]
MHKKPVSFIFLLPPLSLLFFLPFFLSAANHYVGPRRGPGVGWGYRYSTIKKGWDRAAVQEVYCDGVTSTFDQASELFNSMPTPLPLRLRHTEITATAALRNPSEFSL